MPLSRGRFITRTTDQGGYIVDPIPISYGFLKMAEDWPGPYPVDTPLEMDEEELRQPLREDPPLPETAEGASGPEKGKDEGVPLDLTTLIERAVAGDETVLGELAQAFDENPILIELFGNLAELSKMELVTLAFGKNKASQEAIRRQIESMREELALDACTPLERLLVERICTCWVDVHCCEISAANHLKKQSEAAPASVAGQKRLDRAQGRFLAAVKTLAQVKKMLRPPVSRVEVAIKGFGNAVPQSLDKRTASVMDRAMVGVVD